MNLPWAQLELAPAPADEFVGPFPHADFLGAWWRHLGEGEPMYLQDDGIALPLVVRDGVVSCAGDAMVTDYHSPRGTNYEPLAASLMDLRDVNTSVNLDSLPGGSASGIQQALSKLGRATSMVEGETTAIIEVEGEYLAQLSKKQRHEVRRKHRRFIESAGQPDLVRSSPGSFERFAALHRQSAGDKAGFLDGAMEGFFAELASQAGWEFAELMVSGQTVASFFGFRAPTAYYLYNSAFDPRYREVSPGIVALYLLIEDLVESGCRRIDLLKGDETYKFRMGAQGRPLFSIVL